MLRQAYKDKEYLKFIKNFINKVLHKMPRNSLWLYGAILGVTIFMTIYVSLNSEWLVQIKEEEFWTTESTNDYEGLLLSRGVIRQEFVAKYDKLEEFTVIFDDYQEDEETQIKVELCDDNGNTYFHWQESVKNIKTPIFYLIAAPEKELCKGARYWLKVSSDEKNSNVSVRTVIANGRRHGIKDLLVGDIKREERALYLHQRYSYRYSYSKIWCFIGVTALLFVTTIVLSKNKRFLQITNVVLQMASVLVAYYMVESLSGNIEHIVWKMAFKNILIILSLFSAVYALVGVRCGYYIANILALILSIANYYVCQFRGSQLTVYDINSAATARTVAANYDFEIAPLIITSVLLIGLLIVLRCAYDLQDKMNHRKRLLWRGIYGVNAVMICCVFSLVFIPVDQNSFSVYDLDKSFSQYGWGYTNVLLAINAKIDKPKGYSEARVERIISTLQEKADDAITKETIIPNNIIVIMNESFADLGVVGEVRTNKDYMTFINSLQINTIKGNLHVSTFGGGTSITEYEFLTGNSKHFFPSVASPYISICETYEAGLSRTLKEQNYYTVAMHPFDASNWNRDKVYPAFGFDEFLSEEDFTGYEKERQFVSDLGCYKKIIDYYESFDKDKGLFIFNVTMQNHGGYDINNGKTDRTIVMENYADDVVDTYLSLVNKSDQAFKYLLSYFEKIQDPTMIVMFGDHLPSLSNDFYSFLYNGKTTEERTDEEKSRIYMTPYIIWTNYESNFDEVPDMSANYLGSYVLECAGVKMTDYDSFLLKQMQIVPVVGMMGLITSNSQFIPYDSSLEILDDYQILQYMRMKDRSSRFYSTFEIKGMQ